MKEILKVKVWSYKNIVLYEVLEQDERLRNWIHFKATNGCEIRSDYSPWISLDDTLCVYIRGQKEKTDCYVDALEVETPEIAQKLVKDIKQAVKEINESIIYKN